jgi:hypothetical protein
VATCLRPYAIYFTPLRSREISFGSPRGNGFAGERAGPDTNTLQVAYACLRFGGKIIGAADFTFNARSIGAWLRPPVGLALTKATHCLLRPGIRSLESRLLRGCRLKPAAINKNRSRQTAAGA